MFLSYLTLVLILSLLWKRLSWHHPATLFVVYFAIILAISDISIVALAHVTDKTRWTILLGLVGFSLPAAILGRAPERPVIRGLADTADREKLPEETRARHKPSVRLLLWAIALTSLMAIGFYQTQHAGFGLSLLEVRQATTVQALSQQDIGFSPILVSLAPLVAALGVLASTRYRRRRWLVLVLLALGATLPGADKTATLTVVVTATTFYLLCRPGSIEFTSSKPGRPVPATLVVGAAIVVSLAYFVGVNAALGKDFTASDLPSSPLPSALVGPFVYELGGVSALSVAQSANIDPRVDNYGRSVYAVPWVLHLLDGSFHKPQTIALAVPIPIQFNVFTGFGDMWFDFSWLGVFALSAFFGSIVLLAYHRWRPGLYQWGLIISLFAALMASMTISFRLFYLASLFELAVGYLAFRHIAAADAPTAWRYTMVIQRASGVRPLHSARPPTSTQLS